MLDAKLVPAAQRVARIQLGHPQVDVYGPDDGAGLDADTRALVDWAVDQHRCLFPLPPVSFTVARVSTNMNAFGLYGFWLFAENGKVFSAAANSINVPRIGDVIPLLPGRELDEMTARNWEIPEARPDCPPPVLAEVLANARERAAARRDE